MSTSDAGELELRVVGGERAAPPHGTAARSSTRGEQDETFAEKFKQENRDDGAETPTGHQCHPSAIRQDETHKAIILRADRLRKEEAAHCGESTVQTQNPIGPRFTSSLLFRLSRNHGPDKPEKRLKKNLDPCLRSLTEIRRAETKNSTCQVNGHASPLDASITVTSDSLFSERIPFPTKKKEEVITVVCNELEATKDLSITHSFSNGEFGPHECNGLHILPCGPQPRTGTRSVKLEDDIKEHPTYLSDPTRTMLSSSVVTVLAPHWNSRLRRTKRPEGTGNSEAQGSLQDVTNTAANRAHERFQDTVDKSLNDGSQAQFRVPFLGTRRNTVGWSSKSGPASLDYESKRKMIQTVSLDVNAGRLGNSKMDAGAVSSVSTAASPFSPLSLDPHEQRNPQTGHQGGVSSSKPITSSLLLSLRRFNSNGRSSNAASTFSEINPSSLGSSPSDRDGQLFTTHHSQTFLNNNGQERSKPLLSLSSSSYRTTETRPILSPSSSNQRERNTFETRFFSASPTDKDRPFSQQHPTTNRTQSSVSCFKQAFPIRGQSQGQDNCRGSDKGTDVLSESYASSPRHSPYDRSALLNTGSLPRRTTLTSTSWWKQVSQEGSSPLTLNDTMSIKEKSITPLVPPCNDNRDLASPSQTDNKRFSSQIPNNRDNNNTTDSVRKGNMNLIMKTQGGTRNLKQRNAEDSPDHGSGQLVKQQYVSNLKSREPQKPHSLPDVLFSSKISRATEQTTLSHPKELSRHDENNSSFTVNVTELPPTLLNPKSSNEPTESSSNYNNNYCTSKTNRTPISSHNKDSQKSTKPSLSLATTNTSQAPFLKTTSCLPLTPNTNVSQTNIHASTYPSSHTPKFTANATPLAFERSYASVQKPFHPKTVFSLNPTVSASSKTNYSPVSTASPSYSFITGSHPAATTVPSTPLLTPPVTPAIASSLTTVSSLLTPTASPIITDPNYSATASPKEERTFSSSPESDPKKLRPRVGGKKVRRVTWEDSVDLKHSEPITVENPEPSLVPMCSVSPQSIKVPSIFSFQRLSSPTTNTSPLCSPTPKTSSIQVVKQGKCRSLSSDAADLTSTERERSKQRHSETTIFDHGRRDLTTPRQERTLSVESGTLQCHSSAALSLPSDFSSGYKLRYSSPPYSTLMSTRSTHGEAKTIVPRSPLFQQSQSNYTPHLSICNDPVAARTFPTSKSPLSPMSLPQPLSFSFQKRADAQGSKNCGISESDQVNNNHNKNNSQDPQNGEILLVTNRFDEAHDSSSKYVTETLVYSIKSKVNAGTAAPKKTAPKSLQHTANTQVSMETTLSPQSHRVQSKEVTREPQSHSDQSSSGSSSTESQPPGEISKRRMKESVLSKSRFFSVESNNEQSSKKSRFALKKSVSTPNSGLSRSDSERATKTNNKVDQVLNRLKQTFSTRRSDDDVLFPWKWKRASQTSSLSGSSVSDITVKSTPKLDHQVQEEAVVMKNSEKGTEGTNRWEQNKYSLIPPSAAESTMAGDQLCIWSDKSNPETDQDEQNACVEHMEYQNQPHLTIHSPTTHQLDFYKDNRADYKQTKPFLSCRDPSRDPSPGRSPNSADYPTLLLKSASSPRSPFSPFNALSPVSPFTSPDVIDDSVFYSPKLHRRRESPSSCEPGEGISLGGLRRSRASTGPPSPCPVQDKECLVSSYANLKYGIEPGRSFSVSSVLSSRPSGPGRISTGSRFMSVGDLSESALTCGFTSKDLDQWSVTPNWTTEYDFQSGKDRQLSYTSDPGKMRSRSLPRSLTRCLANWSSEVSACPPVTTTTSQSARLRSPNMNTCHFSWDTEGPPTPPPTPPLSPVSRRMSKPPSLSSPNFPSSSGVSQQVDSLSPRGLLPSRGYVSSLSTFEESSDSDSDTTTDDEYYLETGEDKEKETEL